ncbi:MAG TPA: hypothetical protein VGJ59_24440 [Jatrophihabitantaceae bacterium]
MTVAARAPGRVPAAVAALFWVGVPVVCALMLWQGATELATRTHHAPPGMRGNFVVTTHNCQQKLCITGGTFTSDDKALVAKDLLGLYQWKLGSVHRVVYNLDAADVIPLPAEWDPTGAVLGIAGALVLLGIWGWGIRAVRRR